MKRILQQISYISCCLIVSACAGVQYKQAYHGGPIEDAASPPKGSFAFSLRTSTILVTGSGATNGDDDAKKGNVGIIDCKKKDSTGKPVTNGGKFVMLDTVDCLNGVTETAAATIDIENVYFVEPKNTHSFWLWGGTKLAPTTDPTAPLMVKSVAFSYDNKVATTIGAAGADAAAGYTFGPWGAVVGGVVGLVSSTTQFNLQLKSFASKEPNVCKDDLAAYQEAKNNSPSKTLHVPVTLDYDSVFGKVPCWHAFPVPVAGGPSQNIGWFYRMSAEDTVPRFTQPVPQVLLAKDLNQFSGNSDPYKEKTFPFQLTSSFFVKDNKRAEKSFPSSGCVSVKIEIAWWNEIKETAEVANDEHQEANTHAKEMKYASTKMIVADPTVVQLIAWNDGTTVNLLPCGGYATAGTQSVPVSDDFTALFKQAQAVKAAQKDWKKN